jgi:chromosome segregation ATPase
LSYSGGSGKSFGNRGFASQRKEKKRKQEFHKHRLKFTPEEHHSLDQLKERASLGLQKLGTQVFSPEPGGYGLENWMNSFNLLLDDFEEKCNPASLPKEYYDTRLTLTSRLLEPMDTSVLDSQSAQLDKEILSVEEKIADIAQRSERVAVDEWHEDEAKILRLKKERSQIDLDVVKTTADLEEARRKANKSMFKRLFSGTDIVKPVQTKLDSLSDRRQEIEEEIRSLEEDRSRKQSEVKKFDSDISNLRANLEELKGRLGEIGSQKFEVLQIGEKRSEVTKSMADMISSLHFNEGSDAEPNNDSP